MSTEETKDDIQGVESLDTTTSEEEDTTSFKPTKPTMGGVTKQGDKTYVAWTGGKPKSDWSGLQDPDPKKINPRQYRTSSISGAAKSQHYRTMGMTTKFARKNDLIKFQRKVLEHLEFNGMDTITYVPDPNKPSEMISIVEQHTQFTLAEALKAENKIKGYYDKYDEANVEDAKLYLLNSLDEELEVQMYERCERDASFIQVWMHLMTAIGSTSLKRFDKIKEEIRKLKPSQFPGQNIELMSSEVINRYTYLHSARMYDPNLSADVLRSIMEAGNEDFKFPLRSTLEKLEETLLKVRNMTHDEAMAQLSNESLDLRSILVKAKDTYRHLHDNGLWEAAQHAKDSKAIGRNYGSVNMAS